ncbi:UNVERIFIED_CONTAM: hypothetical protein GTU68_028103 [Idotea baltica]|nr:hypothetical protein [Idotea baltica]
MSNKRAVELSSYGIKTTSEVYWNLAPRELTALALKRGEGCLAQSGALVCSTGAHTGRSPKDKFIVKDSVTADKVDWGDVNAPISSENFNKLREAQRQYLQDKTLFVRDAAVGADADYEVRIRVINENAWSNLFAHHLFRRLDSEKNAIENIPQFTIIHTPQFKADPAIHGTNSSTFVAVSFSEGLVIIGGTEYAGEMKKSIFSILNFLYPARNVFPMHCSANTNQEGEVHPALFFGLSGTGKTTLSADPIRGLIGDDEHGWSNQGIFNFEGGCYAKCIRLSKENEPEIFEAIRDGAILENVVLDRSGSPDYNDTSLTENTRAAYPIEYIPNAVPSSTSGHPTNIVFLTCDAFGVMPPLSRLSPKQAMYHFLSGYTAKVAGTERGMGSSPTATFSAGFGSPFLPRHPTEYADMLGARMQEHSVDCWLVNTGWTGGVFGVGERIALKHTRALVNAVINGALKNSSFSSDPVFGLEIPDEVPGVPTEILNPRSLWKDPNAYDLQANKLAELFRENFKQFAEYRPELVKVGL